MTNQRTPGPDDGQPSKAQAPSLGHEKIVTISGLLTTLLGLLCDDAECAGLIQKVMSRTAFLSMGEIDWSKVKTTEGAAETVDPWMAMAAVEGLFITLLKATGESWEKKARYIELRDALAKYDRLLEEQNAALRDELKKHNLDVARFPDIQKPELP